ncbi:MAG TPA: TrbI/VirB10 family protein [Vicinamibacterales bacterium]|nr:TrbI/VirB10 family protein [Vicinamibacterales bacterium]
MATEPNEPAGARGPVRDRRDPPRGVLPRQVQVWLMAGLAAVIVVIILVAGHAQPVPRPSGSSRTEQTTLPDADRIRAYQQQLAADEARLRQVQSEVAASTTARPAGPRRASPPEPADPARQDARRREEQSLFADNVALSRRLTSQQPSVQSAAPGARSPEGEFRAHEPTPQPAAQATTGPEPTRAPLETAASSTPTRIENPAPGRRLRLLEGTVIETVLLNRLDGTFTGPVSCLVTTPVYSPDRQSVLVPAGARVLGAAAPVQAWGDTRLAVTFHRLVMPDGHTYSLDLFKGLNQIGATGLKDEVNRHYWQVFGASLAIGALSGLAQYNTHGFAADSFGDTYRQAAGASLASSSARVLDRYLNVLPTVTIREGFRIKVYLTNDLDLPAYDVAGNGGFR